MNVRRAESGGLTVVEREEPPPGRLGSEQEQVHLDEVRGKQRRRLRLELCFPQHIAMASLRCTRTFRDEHKVVRHDGVLVQL